MLIIGFAPMIPLRTGLKPVALDYSAISADRGTSALYGE